ncbi:DUF3644 domain-containing protein [Pelagicoccus sp. SDUM812002]|uniref:DUF3644 domain-containing protein n=1 Tax=Pelagicoccus sp. SDUM812002 TaxID=3041266 RepID=UPI00280C7ACF|nr:DUF3644 domain-containing protein [Pelagicoccus sp. SDUM812002]MDQ8186807.1 DUF3644 domain-containing protein [Pelagicoccus sp. SDUM812002]
MKARSKELLDRAVAATVAAIEIYNKPDFLYREEAFAVLAINGWELLLKAKWLADHGNKVSSLYVMEPRTKKDGTKSKKLQIKPTASGNPFTHSLDFLAKKLVESKAFDTNAWANIQALLEMRNSSIHFYNRSGAFPVRLQEIGTASLKNFVATTKAWFGRDMSEFNFYLMPLSFIALPQQTDAVVLNHEEKKFLNFVESLEPANDDADSPYSVTVNIDIKFTRSKAKEALGVQFTNDPNAPAVRLTEEQIRERYPWDYDRLTTECRKRYSDFKAAQKYHDIRKSLLKDKRFGEIRFLDPGNPKSSKKPFFSPNILQELDKHYDRKRRK